MRLKTDETLEAVSALEMAAEAVERVSNDVYRWRWVIISIHMALQGFMVLALRGSDGLRPLKDKIAEDWLKAQREGGKRPEEKLDSFLNLYKKIKSKRMLFYGHSKQFVSAGTQDRSIKKMNSLRNDFIHFLPKLWIIEISGLPRISLDCLDVVEFLGWQSGNIFWHKRDQEERAKRSLAKARRILAEIDHGYNRPTTSEAL